MWYRHTQEQNKDVLVVSTGGKGDGKSNFSMYDAWDYIQLFGQFCNDCKNEWIYTGKAMPYVTKSGGIWKLKKKLIQPCPRCGSQNVDTPKKFNFRKYMAYDNDEVEEKIHELPKFSPLLGDEAARWALSEDWNKRENKRIKKLFIQIRTKNLIVFGNIPEFVTLDKKIRNMANYWVRILQRDNSGALAVFLQRDKGEWEDKFHMKDFQKYLGSYFETDDMITVQKRAQRLIKHACVVDVFKIPPIDPKIYATYEEYRNEKVFERKMSGFDIDQKDVAKVAAYNLMDEENWKKLMQETADKKNPTLKEMAYFVFLDPINKKPMITHTTVREWKNEIRDKVKYMELLKSG